jgi:hypothetical protein
MTYEEAMTAAAEYDKLCEARGIRIQAEASQW